MGTNSQDDNMLEPIQGVDPDEEDRTIGEEVRTREGLEVDEILKRNRYRYWYANFFIVLSLAWLGFVSVMIILHAAPGDPHYRLSNWVLVALLGTGLVGMLTPGILLAKYLFSVQTLLNSASDEKDD